MTRLTNLQLLRAFAALNVVLLHVIQSAKNWGYHPIELAKLGTWGASGVDLFFVISGFILVFIQSLKVRSPIDFFLDRVIRICPLYWLLTTICVGLLILAPALFRTISFSPAWAAASYMFIADATLDRQPVLYMGWTLELEMLFYVLFSMSLMAKKLTHSILVAASAIVLANLFLDIPNLIMLIEFIMGMAIAYLFMNKRMSTENAAVLIVLGVLALLASVGSNRLIDDSRILTWGIPAALIVFGCVNFHQVKSGIMTRLGDASYSIYLLQIFMIPLYYRIIKAAELPVDYSSIIAIGCVAASAFAGLAFHVFVEVKMTNVLRAWKTPLPSNTPAA